MITKDFTTGMICKRLKCAPRTVAKWCDSGKLKSRRLPCSQDRRIEREDLAVFLREHGYPYEDLIEDFAFRVLLIGLDRHAEGIVTAALTEGAGYKVMQASNAFHAAKLAYTHGADAVVVDFSIGRTNAREIVPEFPISQHTKAAPLACGIVGDDEPTPFDVPGYTFLTQAGGEGEIVARIKAAAIAAVQSREV